jgi:hypothetical protein
LRFVDQNPILFSLPYKIKQIHELAATMNDTSTAAGKRSRLTKNHLAVLTASFGGSYGVIVKQTQDGFWAVTVKFDGQDEGQAVTTARGEIKVWRNIIGAILFVQENCALAGSVCVEIGDWKLSRLEK